MTKCLSIAVLKVHINFMMYLIHVVENAPSFGEE